MSRFKIQYCFCLIAVLLSSGICAQEPYSRLSTGEDTAMVTLFLRKAQQQRIHAPDSALLSLQEALRISRVLQYEEGIAGSLLSKAFCYLDIGDYPRSKKILSEAYAHCQKASLNNKRILPSFYNGWGSTYSGLGNNDSALHFFYKAITVLEKTVSGDSSLLGQIYNNAGTAWLQKGEFDKALDYFSKAEVILSRTKDSISLGNTYCNIGLARLERKDTAGSLTYLQKALQLFSAKNNSHGIKFTFYALARAQQHLHLARKYYEAALEIDSTSAFAAGVYQGIGSTLYLEENYNGAEPYYLKALAICERQNLLLHKLACYSALSSINEYKGQYREAFRYQVAYANLNDSLLDTEKHKAVSQLELKFRTAEKDKEIAQNKAALYGMQRKLILMGAGSLLLLGLGGSIWHNSRQKQKLQQAQLRDYEQQQKITQLHAKMQGEQEERSRIARELHDGVNVLLSATKMNYAALGKEFKELSDTRTYGEIMELLNNIGIELRTITYKLVPELLIQQSLPDAVETFCELIQKSNALHIELQTFGSFTALPSEVCFAAYRIVQELVHNIVKHSGATQVLIVMSHQDNLLQLTVEDNGNGFDSDKDYQGFGIKSLRSRVKDIDGQITFSSVPGEGTSVEIEVATQPHHAG